MKSLVLIAIVVSVVGAAEKGVGTQDKRQIPSYSSGVIQSSQTVQPPAAASNSVPGPAYQPNSNYLPVCVVPSAYQPPAYNVPTEPYVPQYQPQYQPQYPAVLQPSYYPGAYQPQYPAIGYQPSQYPATYQPPQYPAAYQPPQYPAAYQPPQYPAAYQPQSQSPAPYSYSYFASTANAANTVSSNNASTKK